MLLKNTGGEFILPNAGPDVGVCYLVVDLGTQRGEWDGKESWKRQLLFAFELPNQLHPETGKPLIQYTRRFTASLSESSALRPFLEAWRGQRFSDEELSGFDSKKILRKAAYLGLAHEKKKEKDRSTVISIMPLPPGTKAAALVNEPLFFSTDAWDQATFDKLPEWIQKVINQSEEVKNKAGGGAPAPQQGGKQPAAGGKTGGFNDMDDDIPF